MSSYVWVGGLVSKLTEGDVIVVFSQFGEIIDILLPRNSDSEIKGFGWIGYMDARSAVLAIDNLNGISLLGSKLHVNECREFKHHDPERRKEVTPKEVEQEKEDVEGGKTRQGLSFDPDDPMGEYLAKKKKKKKRNA